ncbi:hypothetical protein DY000_02033152 [Brassica cretica]|uniref:Uncharacterized protein n=1 Tax=Brassica cretica TaxID=69181 RepID=A0ABQ7E025_BRACR|nr:hypothetical protein DY000_02033152 [Brassica cretica]
MESTSRGGETYEEASKRDRRNSQSLMEVGGHVVLHTWNLIKLKSEDRPSYKIRSKRFSVYKRRRKTVGRSSLQLHKFMEEGFTSQLNQFREGFHGVLGLSLHGISIADGVLIYVGISARWYSLVSVKGVAEGLKEIDSCGFVYFSAGMDLREQGVYLFKAEFGRTGGGVKSRLIQDGNMAYEGQTNGSTRYHGCRVVIQVLQELQVSIDIRWKFWRRRINRFVVTKQRRQRQRKKRSQRMISKHVMVSGYLTGRQNHIKSKLDLRRWNQRSSISQGLKVFQRSQGMQVIFAKDDQQILQLHRSQGLKVFQRSQGMQVIFAKDDQQILQLHRLVVV